MRYYGETREQLLDTPLQTFWQMNKNIDRLRAEEDMRSLALASISQSSGEAVKEQQDRFKNQLQQPVVIIQTTPESGGINRLKDIAKSN